MATTIVLVGTGTEIGKTHVAERLLRAFAARGLRAYGYKPIESGVDASGVSDSSRLARASFHVKHEPLRYAFSTPIAPHLAARREGLTIDVRALLPEIATLRALVDALVVELPGGAFSPISDDSLAVDALRLIPNAKTVLVASDRLGVLHDVGAAARGCALVGTPLFGVVLNAPAARDLSTGTNALELARVTALPLLAAFERGPADAALADDDPAFRLARQLIP